MEDIRESLRRHYESNARAYPRVVAEAREKALRDAYHAHLRAAASYNAGAHAHDIVPANLPPETKAIVHAAVISCDMNRATACLEALEPVKAPMPEWPHKVPSWAEPRFKWGRSRNR